jgi:hypothetical protein
VTVLKNVHQLLSWIDVVERLQISQTGVRNGVPAAVQGRANIRHFGVISADICYKSVRVGCDRAEWRHLERDVTTERQELHGKTPRCM